MRHGALWRCEYVPKWHQSHWRSPEGYHLQLEVLVHFLQSRGQRTPPQNALAAHNTVLLREETSKAKVSVQKSKTLLQAVWSLFASRTALNVPFKFNNRLGTCLKHLGWTVALYPEVNLLSYHKPNGSYWIEVCISRLRRTHRHVRNRWSMNFSVISHTLP